MATITTQGAAIGVPCPACGQQVRLHLGPGIPQPDGYLTYNADQASWGMSLHLRVGCEAR